MNDFTLLFLLSMLAVILATYITIRIANKKLQKRTEELEKQIKPFEVKINRDTEKLVAVEKLQEGEIIARNIYDRDEKLVFKKGLIITEKMKEILLNRNINLVYVDLNKRENLNNINLKKETQ